MAYVRPYSSAVICVRVTYPGLCRTSIPGTRDFKEYWHDDSCDIRSRATPSLTAPAVQPAFKVSDTPKIEFFSARWAPDGAGIYFEQQQQQSAIDWAKRAPAWLLVAWPFFLTPSYLTKLKASYSRSFSLYLKNQHEKLCWYPPCLLTLLSQLDSIYISACVSAWRWWWEYCWYKARPSPLSDSTPMLLCNQRRNNRHKLATGIQSRAPATMFTLLVDQLPSPCVCTRVERTDGMNT